MGALASKRLMEPRDFEVRPDPEVMGEIRHTDENIEQLVKQAIEYLNRPDADDMAVARAFIEEGHSDEFAYWLVREANVRRAPGKADLR